MEIWLDTIDLNAIQEAVSLGLVHGVTTNPVILSRAEDVTDQLHQLLDIQKGPVAVQVTTTTRSEMIDEGRNLFAFSPRIIVKVPVNREGLAAIHQLSRENIPVLGTAVLHPKQALLAAIAGARYVAPYVSHIANSGADPFEALESMQKMLRETKIMAASVKQVDHILRFAEMGMGAITIKEDLFAALIENNSLSEALTHKFNLHWHTSGKFGVR